MKSRKRLSDFTFSFHFHALEEETATHSSVLAWRIPGMEEPDGLPSTGSHRVGHDWSDLAAAAVCICQMLFLSSTQLVSLGEGNGSPLHYSCLGNPTERRAWSATVCEVTESDTAEWLHHHHYHHHTWEAKVAIFPGIFPWRRCSLFLRQNSNFS